MKTLCPIRNFGVLQDGKLYRGAQPEYSYEFRWLKDMGVRYMVNLRREKHIDDRYCSLFKGVLNIDIPDHGIPATKDIKRFIDLVRHEDGVFFHCEHGRGRTSTFAVIARLAMGWSLEKAMNEERMKFGYTFQHAKQVEFLENLDLRLLKQ